jgi:hypothetical protein
MRRAGWPFLLIVAAVWSAALAAYAFVWAVDPYEIRGARPGERPADHNYPIEVTPHLAMVAARGGADMVVVGASTAMGYAPTSMEHAFPGVRRAVNLSFPCASRDDMRWIFQRLERSKSLKRVIISLDYTLVWPCSQTTALGAFFDPPWWDPVPEFNAESIRLAASVWRTGVLDLPDWASPNDPIRNPAKSLTQRPAELAQLAREVEAHRSTVTAGRDLGCEAVPAVGTVVMPFVREMSARGVAVELLAPPYSLAYYFHHYGVKSAAHESSETIVSGPDRFPRYMALRRCALQMSAGLPNVRFDGFDDDPSVVGDLASYGSEGHLRGYAAYDRLLRRIAAGQATLRPADWPAYEAKVKAEIDAFQPPKP